MPHTPKTVAFIINSLEFGGAQRVFIDDAQDFVRIGFTVYFFVLYGKSGDFSFEKDLDPAIHTVWLQARSPFDFSAVKKCVLDLRRSNTGALISTLNDGNIFARWVTLVHGSGMRLIQREANTLSSKTFGQKFLDVVFSWVPYRILALSVETELSLKRLLPFSKKKIVRLSNAITIPVDLTLRKERAIPLVLSVGRLTPQKNYGILIAALGILARAGSSFTAVIAGEGYLRKTLETQIEDERLTGKVTLLGHVPHKEILKWYEKADLFVSTSRWEGSPNVILEAMSYALPVVATTVGGVPDIITNGREGYLVSFEDIVALSEAIGRILGDVSLRQSYGTAAQDRVRTAFSRDARFLRLHAMVDTL